MLMKRSNLLFLVLTLLLVISFTVSGITYADYPEKTINIIVPWGPGGATDAIFRPFSEYLKKYLGVSVIVTNISGGGSSVGTQQALNAKPDGYTLLGTQDSIATNYATGITDFNYFDYENIALVASTPNILAVRPDLSVKDAPELFEYIDAHPGELKMAISPGSTSYFFLMGLFKEAGVDPEKVRSIPIEGTAEHVTNLLGGHVDIIMANVPSAEQYFKEGEIKFLGVAHTKRLPQIPDVPTLKEQGLDFVHASNRGLHAPPGTPEEKINVIEEAVKNVVKEETLCKTIEGMGNVMNYMPREEYIKFLEDNLKFYMELSEESGY